MTLDELDENEDDFSEEDEAAIEMYRSVISLKHHLDGTYNRG
jgi:hypothetical protein